MPSTQNNQALKRYSRRIGITMGFYCLFLVVAEIYFTHTHSSSVFAYMLALSPALPCILVFMTAIQYLSEEKDGFQSMLFNHSMLWGSAVTLSFSTIWGFLDNFLSLPHFQLYLLFPMFWATTGIAGAVLRLRYR